MKILVTGGAGFIGRWVVKELLSRGHEVIAYDNLSSGSRKNISEFFDNKKFAFVKADILNSKKLAKIFKEIKVCMHLAAQINVQKSIDDPLNTFRTNVVGTYNLLEMCRKHDTKLILVGTCMVYDAAKKMAINEAHPVKPLSPYASSKLAGEELAFSYFRTYGLPVVITRPFNTYGPYQRSDAEGGVVSIFIRRKLEGKSIDVFGDGTQTRDLLYVEDCASFLLKAMYSKRAVGEVINAGTGKDITINRLALLICGNKNKIRHARHPHPQAEIKKLLCDYSKAKKLLGWEPKITLEEGIRRTEEWMKKEISSSHTGCTG